LFFPRDTDWAKIDNGTVFDVPNCELGHHGEDVSFNSILKKYKLTDPALILLGEIVRAADSHPSKPHAASEGLRWIAGGFSKLGLSDHEILERELSFTTRFTPNANAGSIRRKWRNEFRRVHRFGSRSCALRGRAISGSLRLVGRRSL
jgi:Chromate resistance exported protein